MNEMCSQQSASGLFQQTDYKSDRLQFNGDKGQTVWYDDNVPRRYGRFLVPALQIRGSRVEILQIGLRLVLSSNHQLMFNL